MHKYLAVIMVVFLSACGTPPFKSVTEGPKARVKFLVTNLESSFLKSSEVSFFIYRCAHERLGEIELTPSDRTKTVFVKAETPLYISVFVSSQRRTAWLDVAFTPKMNIDYEIRYVEEGNKFKIQAFEGDQASGKQAPIGLSQGNEHWATCK